MPDEETPHTVWDEALDGCEAWINSQFLYIQQASVPVPAAFGNPEISTPMPPRLEARARLLSAAVNELADQAQRRKAIAAAELVRLRTVTPADAGHSAPAVFLDVKA